MRRRLKQGRAFCGVDMRIVDEDGRELPWDGETRASCMARGPLGRAAATTGPTGATLDRRRLVPRPATWRRSTRMASCEITDRAKDLIKSGGEWISSIALENIAVGHPDVAEAAVIAARHPRWGERPLLLVVAREGRSPEPAGLLASFEGKVPKWWVPDAVLVVAELLHTGTGKLAKAALRERYGGHYAGQRSEPE